MAEQDEEKGFAELLAEGFTAPERFAPGQKVEVVIVRITKEWVFLDLGGKSEGVMSCNEVRDREGNIVRQEGDRLQAYFLKSDRNGMHFTIHLGSGSEANAHLEEAQRSGIPVEGTVEKEIKGGMEIKLAGKARAFCPFSQLSLRRLENAALMIGQTLPFKITEYKEGGRNIVVSHRAFLEEQQESLRESLKETLEVGQVVRGTVTSLQKFGAFIDIGGLEGLLPISEIGWSRVEDLNSRLAVGQELQVAIVKLDWENNRFSFSLKATLPDPWATMSTKFPVGSIQIGSVARLMDFGAFVTLGDGIDGLLHISNLGGGRRINHPREVVKVGDQLEVRIEKIDAEERRISLALANQPEASEEEKKKVKPAPEDADNKGEYQRYLAEKKQKSQQPAAPTLGTLGELLAAKMKGK